MITITLEKEVETIQDAVYLLQEAAREIEAGYFASFETGFEIHGDEEPQEEN